MIGAAPNTDWLSGLAATDEKGFVLTGAAAGRGDPYETTAEGIFAVGDVRAGSVKRVASAVGEGSVVVSRIWQYLEDTRPAGVKAGTHKSTSIPKKAPYSCANAVQSQARLGA